MDIAQAKRQIKDSVEAYIALDGDGMNLLPVANQRPVFLVGPPGIGKTAIMEQIARELGIGIVSYSMTHHTRQSALGLPRIEHKDYGEQEFDVSVYTMSEIIVAVYDYIEETGLEQGILFLDEINCVSETLYPSMLQFLQFKVFGKHKVPEGWIVVCAGNPPEYNRSVHEFDIVTLDRLRKIEVEPDFESWQKYAKEAGVHPSIMTFLETKNNCFYKVETRPGGGKSFVTARGWEDLSRVISVYEKLGKPVDDELISQFLNDEDISNQFAVYYALFKKYQSDYEVDTILAGAPSTDIKVRAQESKFDERVAIIGLLLDAISVRAAEVLEAEEVTLALRDILRDVKAKVAEGGSASALIEAAIEKKALDLRHKKASNTVSHSYVKLQNHILNNLKKLLEIALHADTDGGDAFAAVSAEYKQIAQGVKTKAAETSTELDNVFIFIDDNLSERELLVFLAELATRGSCARFIAHYGSEQYYIHNKGMDANSAVNDLARRAQETAAPEMALDDERDDSNGEGAEGVGAKLASTTPSVPAGVSAQRVADVPDVATLASFYENTDFEYGFSSICKMTLPAAELKGKTVLDIGCRRGRGVYKISSMVGASGHAIGVDWVEHYIKEAQAGSARAARESGLASDNMTFHIAFPERLIDAGLGSGTIDAVYVNNVINLFYDPRAALAEIARVLKPGGMLVLETVVSDKDNREGMIAQARRIGNSIQAARSEDELLADLSALGFCEPKIVDSYDVAVDQGYKPTEKVDYIKGDDEVSFKAVCMYIIKNNLSK